MQCHNLQQTLSIVHSLLKEGLGEPWHCCSALLPTLTPTKQMTGNNMVKSMPGTCCRAGHSMLLDAPGSWHPHASEHHECMPVALLLAPASGELEASSRSMRARSYTWRMLPEAISQSLKYDWMTPWSSRFFASSSDACRQSQTFGHTTLHRDIPQAEATPIMLRVTAERGAMEVSPSKRVLSCLPSAGGSLGPLFMKAAVYALSTLRTHHVQRKPPTCEPRYIRWSDTEQERTALTALRRSDTAATLRSLASS